MHTHTHKPIKNLTKNTNSRTNILSLFGLPWWKNYNLKILIIWDSGNVSLGSPAFTCNYFGERCHTKVIHNIKILVGFSNRYPVIRNVSVKKSEEGPNNTETPNRAKIIIFIFDWSIVCVSFKCTAQWFSFCRLHFIIDYNKASGILHFLGRKALWETVLITDLHKQGSLELKHHKTNQQFMNIFSFIFDCSGSSSLHVGFILLQQVWATLCCSAQDFHWRGFFCCGFWALEHRFSSCGAWA